MPLASARARHRQSAGNILAKTPADAGFRQPDKVSPKGLIGRRPIRRDRQAVMNPAALGRAGVFVIVVGNYFAAAFYEASGASTCRIGFHIPVETSAPPSHKVKFFVRLHGVIVKRSFGARRSFFLSRGKNFSPKAGTPRRR